jgi:hypothetical protein
MKSSLRKFLQHTAAYLLLLPILVMGMWLFLLGREVLGGLLSAYFVGGSFLRGYQAGLFDRAFLVIVGVGWMVLFVVAEELLRRSASKGGIIRIFSRFMGVECLLAVGLDGIMLFLLSDFSTIGWARWLIVGGELVCGAALTYLGWSKHSPFYQPKVTPGIL